MLDPGEALKHLLKVKTCKKLSKSFVGEGDRPMVVAFHKTNNTTSAIAMFKKTPYELCLMETLPLLKIHRYILNTSHKTQHFNNIIVSKTKGKCLEHICIATGFEELHNLNVNKRHQSTMYVCMALTSMLDLKEITSRSLHLVQI